jgi:hypothetical protein
MRKEGRHHEAQPDVHKNFDADGAPAVAVVARLIEARAYASIALGIMGVSRKIASSAAKINDVPTPATHAVQPNLSKIWPSIAAPARPPK